jgi:hypothetical protein
VLRRNPALKARYRFRCLRQPPADEMRHLHRKPQCGDSSGLRTPVTRGFRFLSCAVWRALDPSGQV